MIIKILFFGITADLVHTTHLTLDIDKDVKVASFKAVLESKYPQLKNVNSYAIAVNEAYASDDLILRENDTVAIIPPVSGG